MTASTAENLLLGDRRRGGNIGEHVRRERKNPQRLRKSDRRQRMTRRALVLPFADVLKDALLSIGPSRRANSVRGSSAGPTLETLRRLDQAFEKRVMEAHPTIASAQAEHFCPSS